MDWKTTPTLEEMYLAMKGPLATVGGYGKLDDEQRDLFNVAVDALMAAKFAEGEPHQKKLLQEADRAVTQFLGAMPPEPEDEAIPDTHDELKEQHIPVVKPASYEAILIRAADALDKAGMRKLADEVDSLLRR